MGTLLRMLIAGLVLWAGYRFVVSANCVQSIPAEELLLHLNKKEKQFVDVRTVNEFKGNGLNVFKNVPLHDLPNRMGELSKDHEVLVICQRGIRSRKASQLLKKNEFKKVTNIKDGMISYHRQ